MHKKLKTILIMASLMLFAGLVSFALTVWHLSVVQETHRTSLETLKAIQIAQSPVKGTYSAPQTTKELEVLFQGVQSHQMPRLFIKRLPSDFKPDTVDRKTLFMKVMTALMLKANEEALNDRIALQMLVAKKRQGQKWTLEERKFFDWLVQKYDSVLLKTIDSQIVDLLNKVDEVPVSIGVALAAWRTNWGSVHQDSPFAQYEWINADTYAPASFDTLETATDSFVRELNTSPSLIKFRAGRDALRPVREKRAVGDRLVSLLSPYLPDEAGFEKSLRKMYQEGYFLPLDHAAFISEGTK